MKLGLTGHWQVFKLRADAGKRGRFITSWQIYHNRFNGDNAPAWSKMLHPIVILAHNEADNLPQLLNEIRDSPARMESYEVVVVNGSPKIDS